MREEKRYGKRSSHRRVRPVFRSAGAENAGRVLPLLQDVCSYAELSAMEQRYNIAEKLVSKQSYTSIMGNIGASSAIISRVSRVISKDDSVLRRLLEEKADAATEE